MAETKSPKGHQFVHEPHQKKPRKQSGAVSVREWIPSEMVVDILQKLPDKSLMRFLCVSKTWFSLISDPKLMINTRKLLLLSLRSMSSIDCSGSEEKVKKLHCDVLSRKNFTILGSSNGLLLIYLFRTNQLFIWNPITRVEKWVTYNLHYCWPSLGFTYDNLTDDYKIVSITSASSGAIYSMRTDCWRPLEEIQYTRVRLDVNYNKGGTVASNAVYWFAIYESDNLLTRQDSCVICYNDDIVESLPLVKHEIIFRFDLVDETRTLLSLPPGTEKSKLMDFKGCLCFSQIQYDSGFDMWILTGNSSTNINWSKLMRIEHLKTLTATRFLSPIYFARNGEILLTVKEKNNGEDVAYYPYKTTTLVYSYNPMKKRFRRYKIRGINYWSSEITYSENQLADFT
ncbi:F-box protein [Quillaja saponaria]|uniref:F-box protein n=1 Tax=Quillaja saponaria TaxID=32244 RepID=A0AAD7M327_QUISA|nr:F-box protein [Quillaja saponaria]